MVFEREKSKIDARLRLFGLSRCQERGSRQCVKRAIHRAGFVSLGLWKYEGSECGERSKMLLPVALHAVEDRSWYHDSKAYEFSYMTCFKYWRTRIIGSSELFDPTPTPSWEVQNPPQAWLAVDLRFEGKQLVCLPYRRLQGFTGCQNRDSESGTRKYSMWYRAAGRDHNGLMGHPKTVRCLILKACGTDKPGWTIRRVTHSQRGI